MQDKKIRSAKGLQAFYRAFLTSEASGGLLLMGVAVIALIVANSPLAEVYFGTLERYVLGMSVLHWINDALMAVFFLLVGLEIKREMLVGQLSTWGRRALPGLAALGGAIFPAIIYAAINWGNDQTISGWAIPTATDIAFALGVLSLLGSRIPVSLKIFLTALAILDDLFAVCIIAVFYTADLSLEMLGLAALTLGVLIVMNRLGVTRILPYLVVGVVLWFFVFKSGVHATLAGVALALTIPLRTGAKHPPLERLEHTLHPYTAFLVIPIFGFANAGVSFEGVNLSSLMGAVPLGIALGLLVGKQFGVFSFAWLAIRLGLAELPEHATWKQLYGIGLLCGIGFTMSLFIGLLAFPSSPELVDAVKIGVLLGSVTSGCLGALMLVLVGKKKKA
ncbi:sodium/proton antiporter, NhaA family (TC 2.A.33.1.1) [Pseudomonas duriflava]|uniref:Na(+)/H(+) antiporter NhaA n=1 Tax=Pseudomonas duriflava TaxID=459528 RepID=A0A562Q6I0_9PSED|nr:Na+/H+ antiporter NhaA [Pseudomonas duriflava]TWI52339.1 sodium/proton antiporter, NhaA family (TC 2.A.33.1.1) [Pseudomonas duriflava]